MKRILLLVLGTVFFWSSNMKAEEPLVKFGVVTDVHYSILHPANAKHPTRMYKMSKQKMQEAVNTFNQNNVAFTAVLGDNIDGDIESFAEIKPVFKSLKKPVYRVLGNHDFLDVYGSQKMKFVQKELEVKKPYYSVVVNNVRFIFCDSNDLATYSRSIDTPEGVAAKALLDSLKRVKAKAAHSYNGTFSRKQMDWIISLAKKSAKKQQMVILFAHDPLLPTTLGGSDLLGKEHADELSLQPNIKAVLTGHHHEGSQSLDGRVKHYNFQGMIEDNTNHYSIVSVYADRLEIQGFGEQESRVIKF